MANSEIILFQSFALIIPLATRIPFDPNSIAFATSSPDTIPAPQSNFVLFFDLLTMSAALAINSGFSLGQQRYLYKKTGVLGDVGSGGS